VCTMESCQISGSRQGRQFNRKHTTTQVVRRVKFRGTLSGDQAQQFVQFYKKPGKELRTQFRDTRAQLAEKSVEFIRSIPIKAGS